VCVCVRVCVWVHGCICMRARQETVVQNWGSDDAIRADPSGDRLGVL